MSKESRSLILRNDGKPSKQENTTEKKTSSFEIPCSIFDILLFRVEDLS